MEVKVPVLPENINSAEISAVHVKKGDHVQCEQAIFDIETDKVVLEVTAPLTGIMGEFNVTIGQTVMSEQVLTYINETNNPVYTNKVQPKELDVEKNQHAENHNHSSVNYIGIIFGIIALTIMFFIFKTN